MTSWDSPLVRHLLTSWWPAWHGLLVTLVKVLCPVAESGFYRWGGCASPLDGSANILFCQSFPENCMKMKEFGPGGGGSRVPGGPLRSANAVYSGKASRLMLQADKPFLSIRKKYQNKNCLKHNTWVRHFRSDDVIMYIQNDVILISIKVPKACPRKLCAPP